MTWRSDDRVRAVMVPVPAARVEAVVGEQPVAVLGDEVHRVDEVFTDGVADEVAEVEPRCQPGLTPR